MKCKADTLCDGVKNVKYLGTNKEDVPDLSTERKKKVFIQQKGILKDLNRRLNVALYTSFPYINLWIQCNPKIYSPDNIKEQTRSICATYQVFP